MPPYLTNNNCYFILLQHFFGVSKNVFLVTEIKDTLSGASITGNYLSKTKRYATT